MKFRKIIAIILICIFALMVPVTALADTKDELEAAEAAGEELEAQLEESQARLEELRGSEMVAEAKVAEVEEEIGIIEAIIADYESQIETNEAKVSELEKSITEKASQIDDKYKSMSMRIQYMYENLGDDYVIETLFSSESIGEIFKKTQYMTELANYDKRMMDEIKKAKEEIEEEKALYEKELRSLGALKEAQEGQKQILIELKEEREAELREIEEMIALEEAMEAQLQDEIATQQSVIDELTEQYNSEVSAGNPSYNYTGGTFLWPVAGGGWISSGYGYREGEYSGFHAGVDIATAEGTPIYSVLDGVVVSAYYSDSAGNFTIIYHGNGMYTEYMHQSVIGVYAGQNVSAGEVIGYVGSTGWSTGPHLHFGLAISDGGYSSGARVDPSPYLGLY